VNKKKTENLKETMRRFLQTDPKEVEKLEKRRKRRKKAK